MHLGSSRLNSITSRLQPRWLRLGGLAVAACLTGTLLPAQDTPAQSGATPTLHVYTNLVQIPVLVLTPEGENLADCSKSILHQLRWRTMVPADVRPPRRR